MKNIFIIHYNNAKYIEELEILILSTTNRRRRANIWFGKKSLLRLDVRLTQCVLSRAPTVVTRISLVFSRSLATPWPSRSSVHEVVHSLEPSALSSRREQKSSRLNDWATKFELGDSETLTIVKITDNKEDPKLRDVNL